MISTATAAWNAARKNQNSGLCFLTVGMVNASHYRGQEGRVAFREYLERVRQLWCSDNPDDLGRDAYDAPDQRQVHHGHHDEVEDFVYHGLVLVLAT